MTPPASLDQPSRIVADKITTVPRTTVADHLGRIADAELVQLNRALVVFPGLAG